MPEKRIVYEDASKVKAVDGSVHVDGPDDVHVTLSAEAAEQTSERLLEGSFHARGQRRLKRYPHRGEGD